MRRQAQGFTLIELSIVLVIIGLVVGGVLVGRDLIVSAQVRAQISQIEKFNTAKNTFYGKFSALAGDMDTDSAAQFGLPAHANMAPDICGVVPNDGVLQGLEFNNGCGLWGQGSYETGQFWTDMASPAGGYLIEGSFPGVNAGCSAVINASNVATCLPTAKIGNDSYVSVLSLDSINWYYVSAQGGADPGYNDPPPMPALSVAQAYNIDKKMDDGLPFSGGVMADITQDPAFFTLQHAGSDATCYDNGNVASAAINYSTTYGGARLNCALYFKFQ